MLQGRFERGALGQCSEKWPDPFGEAAADGVREADGALEPGAAHEADRLGDGGVGGDVVEVAELVGSDAQGGAHLRVEAGDRPASQFLDGVVERAPPLDGAEGDALGEGAVAGVELHCSRLEGPVGVGVLLEDA